MEKLTEIKDKLYEIKNRSNRSEDDTDEKGKQIVELKKNKKEFNHKNKFL